MLRTRLEVTEDQVGIAHAPGLDIGEAARNRGIDHCSTLRAFLFGSIAHGFELSGVTLREGGAPQ